MAKVQKTFLIDEELDRQAEEWERHGVNFTTIATAGLLAFFEANKKDQDRLIDQVMRSRRWNLENR